MCNGVAVGVTAGDACIVVAAGATAGVAFAAGSCNIVECRLAFHGVAFDRARVFEPMAAGAPAADGGSRDRNRSAPPKMSQNNETGGRGGKVFEGVTA